MKNFDANDVANWILFEAKRQNIPLTHMKLQKLLYYAQAYMIGMTGEPLFDNQIQAWKHGPVIPDVYHKYSKYGGSVISDLDGEVAPDEYAYFISDLVQEKGHYSAYELRNMTHNEQSWNKAISGNGIVTPEMLNEEFTPIFWTSDEEDDYQPSFNTKEEEREYFLGKITDEERHAIINSR